MSDEKISENVFGINTPMREKYWKEKTADEKIETLANVVHHLSAQLRGLQERVGVLSVHTHAGPDAEPLVPLAEVRPSGEVSEYDYAGYQLGRLSDGHYQ